MGSGKTTTANLALDKLSNLGYNRVMVTSFAKPIKDLARSAFSWDGKKDEKGRLLLQRLGTEVGRMYNEQIWIAKTIDNILRDYNFPQDVVLIDDWRYKNEYWEMVNSPFFDVYPLRVTAPFEIENNHVSEHDLESFEVPMGYIYNDKPIEYLSGLVDGLVKNIVKELED